MTTSGTGSAREIPPGRLSNFEDVPVEDAPPPLLPPRRTSKSPSSARGATNRSKKVAERPVRAAETSTASPEPTSPSDASAAPETAQKGPEDKVRPSNVHIPVALLDPLVAKCKADGLSHGEVIIVAIENAYPRLKDLIHPVATAGGGLFASRRSRASRKTDGPLTPLNYRLREADFATLDQLVEEFGASSRGHLITAALSDFFGDN